MPFEKLPASVKTAHRQGPVSRFAGTAGVEGANVFTWLPARLFGFPRKADSAPVLVVKRLTAPGRETWERTIGASRFRSEIVHAGPGRVTEKFGPFTFTLALEATHEQLIMSIAGWRMGWLPLPAFLAATLDRARRRQRKRGLYVRRANRCAVVGTADPL